MVLWEERGWGSKGGRAGGWGTTEAPCSHPNETFLGTQSCSSQGALYFQDYPGTWLHLPMALRDVKPRGPLSVPGTMETPAHSPFEVGSLGFCFRDCLLVRDFLIESLGGHRRKLRDQQAQDQSTEMGWGSGAVSCSPPAPPAAPHIEAQHSQACTGLAATTSILNQLFITPQKLLGFSHALHPLILLALPLAASFAV